MSDDYMSSGRRLRQAALKQRVKYFEAEVAELKTKLDQLRKAKTIVKRNVVFVGGGEEKRRANETCICQPTVTDKAHHCQSPGQADLSEKNEDAVGRDEKPTVIVSVSEYNEEKELMKQQVEETLQKEQENNIKTLFGKLSELNDENVALAIENNELMCQVAQLNSELSVNEAKCCEREENIKAEINAEWRKKYDSWKRNGEEYSRIQPE